MERSRQQQGHHRQLPHPHRIPPRPREETPTMLLQGASRRGRSGLPRNHLRHYRQGKQEARPEPTYYGWIDYLHYVTDDDRNDDCNRHILPFERRARIGYTLESILKFVNDLGASFDAVAVCPDLGGYRVFRDGYSPKGTERLNYGDEFQYDPDMTARREAVYRHVYELEKAEGSRYPNFSLWVDQDDPGMLHLLRHFSGTFKTAHNTHWTIRTDTGSTVEDWMATATVTPLGRYGC